jgi:hypothetical protein
MEGWTRRGMGKREPDHPRKGTARAVSFPVEESGSVLAWRSANVATLQRIEQQEKLSMATQINLFCGPKIIKATLWGNKNPGSKQQPTWVLLSCPPVASS